MLSTVEFDASTHGIEAVTIFYGSDRAEVCVPLFVSTCNTVLLKNIAQVTRKISVQLQDGQNTVKVTSLSSGIDKDSIRVNGLGRATIFDVIYRPYFR